LIKVVSRIVVILGKPNADKDDTRLRIMIISAVYAIPFNFLAKRKDNRIANNTLVTL